MFKKGWEIVEKRNRMEGKRKPRVREKRNKKQKKGKKEEKGEEWYRSQKKETENKR